MLDDVDDATLHQMILIGALAEPMYDSYAFQKIADADRAKIELGRRKQERDGGLTR